MSFIINIYLLLIFPWPRCVVFAPIAFISFFLERPSDEVLADRNGGPLGAPRLSAWKALAGRHQPSRVHEQLAPANVERAVTPALGPAFQVC